MMAGKVIELIKTFNGEEFKKFGLFIRSPYFNKEKIQVKFYDILKKYYPDFNSRNFEKEKIFSKLYPGKKYNDGVMRNILSTSLTLAGDFLSVHRLQKDGIQYRYNIAAELNARRQNKLYEREASYIDDILQNEIIKDAEFFYKKFLLANENRRFNTRQKSSLVTDEKVLHEVSENLALSFMINMLRIHTYIANTNKYMYHYEQNKGLMNGIENHLISNFDKYKSITSLVYYFNFFMLSKTEEEKYFFELRNLFREKYNELSDIDKRNTYTILANYCYTRINKGDLNFLNEQFNIYKQNIDTGYYRGERGFMSHIFFINVVVTGLEAGQVNWVGNFIEKYNSELDSVNRDNTITFCRAFYCYWNKDYSRAMELAAMVKTDDPSYKHQLKSLYLKIYFDLREIEPFYSHVDNYRHFIAGDKNIGEQVRITINNYINFAKRIFDLKLAKQEDETELEILRDEIIANKAMINKPWLLRKIEESKNAHK